MVKFREEIADLKPYDPGMSMEDVRREYNVQKVAGMALNENPLGCSPRAKEAMVNALDSIGDYPDGNAMKLRGVLSSKLGIGAENILPTNGLDEMIGLVAKAFVDKGDEVIVADITFPSYMSAAVAMGGKPVVVPLKDFTMDLNKVLESISEKTKVIWICNPNNPTGTIVTENELIDFLEKVPSHILVISDEAYREYVTREDYPHDTVKLLSKYENLLVMRTFSKAYGLAGIRVGYTMGDKSLLDKLNRVRETFNVNALAQAAAIAAFEDEDFLKKSYDLNLEGKNYLYGEFDKLGFYYAPSETNHIFVNVGKNGREIFEKLQEKGVIIRPMGGSFIRVSIGSMEENRLFIEKLKEVL
ncbi:MAG: histidinol-phosphate transaminase [Tissierellaceae bacterium]|nr:histidinol-phosphate transaminase [Tissierellaceae bacterium]